MKNICLVCISLRAGGTERIVSQLANDFVERDRVTIITLTSIDPFYVLDKNVKLSQYRSRKPREFAPQYYFRLFKFLRRKIRHANADVVFSFGELINPFVRFASAFLPAPIILCNRASPLASLKGISGILNPIVYPFARSVVVQTDRAVSILRRRYPFSQFRVIPNPVTIPKGVPRLATRERVVICVGFLGGEKNQGALIRAFAKAASGTDWILWIVGDGPNRSTLEELGEKLAIGRRIEFLGERKDVSDLLLRCQVFAFSSLSEGFPNALAEALAHGCACISFDCPTGPSELIENEVNGLLIPLGAQQHYEKMLTRLLTDDNLRERLSRYARRHIYEFSSESVIARFARLANQDARRRK